MYTDDYNFFESFWIGNAGINLGIFTYVSHPPDLPTHWTDFIDCDYFWSDFVE